MNACIVGYGAIGPIHAEALMQVDCAELYAICDADQERADKGASLYKAKAYYDYEECINDEAIDCVHICTPHYLHFEMITKALDKGKSVIVEKPAVMKKSEFDELFAKYDVSEVFPVVQNRKNTCIQALKEIIAKDKNLGTLRGIKGIVTWCRDADYYNSENWRGTKLYEGGGTLINQAIHILDLMVYFAGSAESVFASMRNNSLRGVIDVEDTIDAYIEFKSGTKGIFYATNAYTTNSPIQLELDFENRSFVYANGILFSDGEVICKDSGEFKGKSYWGNGHAKILSDFYENNSRFSLSDIRYSMEAMFAIYESAQKNKEISL